MMCVELQIRYRNNSCDKIRRILAIKTTPSTEKLGVVATSRLGGMGERRGVPPSVTPELTTRRLVSIREALGSACVQPSFNDAGAAHRHPGPPQSVQQNSSTPAQSEPSRRVSRGCSCTPRGINTQTPWRDIHSQPLPSTASSFLDPAS
jgi:hypothetical protein